MSSKSGQKSIRKITSKKGRSREVRGEDVVEWPSWGPEGAIIKEVWILRRSNYSRIRIFGALVIRIFGIVFGDTDIRKNVLHADPVGRRILDDFLKK